MSNRYVQVLLICIVPFLISNKIFAQQTTDPVPAGASQRAAVIPQILSSESSAVGGNQTDVCGDVKIPFSQLRFVGFPVPIQPTKCVKNRGAAINREMRRFCDPGGNDAYVLNPGNKVYNLNASGGENTNPDAYFYCVPNLARTWKLQICQVQAPARYGTEFDFKWKATSGRDNGDGICECKAKNETNYRDCSQPTTPAETLTGATSGPEANVEEIVVTAATCKSIGLTRYNPNPFPAELGDGYYCQCDSTGTHFFRFEEAANRCAELSRAVTAAAASAEAEAQRAQVEQAALATQFQDCLQSWRNLSQTCKQEAESGKQRCQGKVDRAPTLQIASGLAGAAAGTQENCMAAGSSAIVAREAYQAVRDNCNVELQICNRDCAPEKSDEFLRSCSARLNKSSDQLLQETSPEGRAFKSAYDEIKQNYESGHNTCENDIRRQNDQLAAGIASASRTAQVAAQCACKTSSTAGVNCDSIPTIEVCNSSSGTSAGCNLYGSMGACAQGTPAYDSKDCACARNPSTPGCASSGTTAQITSFPTNAVPAASAGGGAVSGFAGGSGSGGSGGGGSFGDLSGSGGGSALSVLAGNIKEGAAPTIVSEGSAGGATVGGGGSGSSGGVSPDQAAAPPAKATGLKGLFNDIKTTVSKALFGSGAATPQKGRRASSDNMTQFKPNAKLRGGPVQRDIASANEKTIFELVNECANGLRCKSVTATELLKGP